MNNLIKRIFSSIILLPLVFYFIINGSLMLIFFLVVCFVLASYEWNKISKNKYLKIFGFTFLIISFYTFYLLSIEFEKLLIVILICISTDIGGYVFGKIFQGPKLTKISPNKTYAGMIGGYFLSLISFFVITQFINSEIPAYFLIIVILISTISQIGDVIISYFKRLSKVKNTGKIIPGHGGLLDRIDGMIFAFPMFYIIDLIFYLKV